LLNLMRSLEILRKKNPFFMKLYLDNWHP
jgi:hypothetical protein